MSNTKPILTGSEMVAGSNWERVQLLVYIFVRKTGMWTRTNLANMMKSDWELVTVVTIETGDMVTFVDIWLAVHHSITFLLLPTWYTNFLFIHTNYIKLNSSACFESIPPIIRRSTTQIVYMQPLVSPLCKSELSKLLC